MEKKIEDKIKDLKKGDTVVLYNCFDSRTRPFEIPIKSIGKKWITVINSDKFDPMGNGNYGWKPKILLKTSITIYLAKSIDFQEKNWQLLKK